MLSKSYAKKNDPPDLLSLLLPDHSSLLSSLNGGGKSHIYLRLSSSHGVTSGLGSLTSVKRPVSDVANMAASLPPIRPSFEQMQPCT